MPWVLKSRLGCYRDAKKSSLSLADGLHALTADNTITLIHFCSRDSARLNVGQDRVQQPQ